jgi:hypothetical protein
LRPGRLSSISSFAALAATVALGACGGGSGGGSGPGSGDDSGMTTDSTGGGPDGSMDSGGAHDSSGGGQDSTTGHDSGGSSGDGGDAAFAFDGFAHPDGWSPDASNCPDDDGDGWTVCAGDCNDHDSQINPCAFDTNDPNDPVGVDHLDNDCDGFVDNLITCEATLVAGPDYKPVENANAANICDNPKCAKHVGLPQTVTAIWYGPSPKNAQRVTAHMGSFVPKTVPVNPPGAPAAPNPYMTFLSNGTAQDETDPGAGGYATCDGTDFAVSFMNSWALPASQNTNPCGTGVDESTVPVHDYTELRMTIKAPINAGSYSFDFAFFSEEFPVYVCRGFNDTFLAIQWSQQFQAMHPGGYEIAYDSNGHRINVNNLFFQDCKPCNNCVAGSNFNAMCPNGLGPLSGTFYEKPINTDAIGRVCNQNWGSGGTDWLTTTSPVNPGETFTLSWIVFDENDGILDSSVILDHFRWHSTTLGSPVTAR